MPVPDTAPAAATDSPLWRTWVDGYAPMPGIPDEFIGPDGKPRDYWVRFLKALDQFTPQEIARRFASADRHIKDTGVSYRVYGETSERSWPLSHVPMLIGEDEWRQIAAGVEQRACLLEEVLRDLYGDGRLVRDGALPAAVVTGSPEFLRPLHGVSPRGKRHLHLYAADLGRGPDGSWWVLGDRTQAPSGMGYTLQNRLTLARAFPDLFQEMNVERLAAFFREFRAGLTNVAERSEPRICLLSSGPFSETYFEQTYLARYLGFLLVEGEDLMMRDGRIHVRTIAGLKRADVLWRRIDSDFCDPLELNTASSLGVPGLVDSLRSQNVVMANMPGAGIVETRALLSFMPGLCRRVLAEPLILPNIATWWCGQPGERETVLRSLDDLAIAGAFGGTVPGFAGRPSMLGAELREEDKERLAAAIRRRGVDYVGQEVVRLSTTPAWENGRLTPRPFVLRVFATPTKEGWKVMPGGFCRVSDRPDARAVAMGDGVQSADVWVLARKPVDTMTLLPNSETIRIRRLLGNLPSRAADNLFWLGRYLERAEATMRLVRCLCSSLIEPDLVSDRASQTIERLKRLLVAWGAVSPRQSGGSAAVAAAAFHGPENYGSALSITRAARRAASTIRERLSADSWQLIGTLEERLQIPHGEKPSEAEVFDRAEEALQFVAALSGLAQENINRVAGWRFLDMGRRVERGINTCRFARRFASRDATRDDLQVLLELVDSQITYRSRYIIGVALAPVRDMVALDPYNPRSVAFQVQSLGDHLANLPVLREDGIMEAPRRAVLDLQTEITIEEAANLDDRKLLVFEQKLSALAQSIASRYFLPGANAARSERLAGLA